MTNLVVERLDIDRADCDNFISVILKLCQRRRGFNRAYEERLISDCLLVQDVLHIVLVGRRFSSKLSPAVYNPIHKTFELEDRSSGEPVIKTIPLTDLGGHVKQESWENELWDREEEERLLALHARQLRACLDAAGFHPYEYEIYHGGFAALSGLSGHLHSQDFYFMDLKTSKFRTSAELSQLGQEWRNLSVVERATLFRQITEPTDDRWTLRPLDEFAQKCLSTGCPIHIYVGSPMTAVADTFTKFPELIPNVTYLAAMGGAWDGSKNLLGTCFNNAVDIEASRIALAMFNQTRVVLVPTETCKEGPFTLPPTPIGDSKAQLVIYEMMKQWTDIKRGPQPLFDCVIFIPFDVLMDETDGKQVTVSFGSNPYGEGTMFEDVGMGLKVLDQPSNIYATGRAFKPTCAETFLKLFDV
jgi:hypothetical protein